MRVSDLVLRAGSVLKFAYLDRAELSRRTVGQIGESALRVDIDLGKALTGASEHNLFLEDFDHLVVRQIPDIELQRDVDVAGDVRSLKFYPLVEGDPRTAASLQRAGSFVERVVEVTGEVRFPGSYPIFKGERLSSVLRRAGGFTALAYLRGSVLTRQSVKVLQERRLRELLQEEEESLLATSATGVQGALSPEEVQGQTQALNFRRDLLNRLRTVQPEGRMVIRLRALDTLASSTDDVELEASDRLIIPPVPKYISVLGQVYNRASLLYEPKKSVGH